MEPRPPKHPVTRPPSYSDSFFFLPVNSEPLIVRPAYEDSLSTPPTSSNRLEQLIDNQQPKHPYTICERWVTRGLSFTCHLVLISVFETVFFFHYVSVSEDAGLQSTLDSYLAKILSNCHTWSPNQTALLNDLISMFINATQVEERGAQAAVQRQTFNDMLQVRSWLCSSVIGALFLVCGTASCVYRLRIAWRRMAIENCVMILMLGLYELLFFTMIVYNYENMEQPELDAFLVTQLQDTCGIL